MSNSDRLNLEDSKTKWTVKMPEIAGWLPVKETHSILTASCTILFGEEVGDVLWRKIEDELSNLAKSIGLTDRDDVTQTGLPPALEALMRQGAKPLSRGVSYKKLVRPDYYAERITATRNSLNFEEWEYTRWAPFAAQLQQLLPSVFDLYSGASSLRQIQLQYADVFHSQGLIETADTGALLSGFGLENPAFQHNQPWHSHYGWFEFPDEHIRRLINLNLDVIYQSLEGGDGLTVQIATSTTDQFGQKGCKALADKDVTWGLVEESLNQLHIKSKAVLGDVLSDGAKHAISLS